MITTAQIIRKEFWRPNATSDVSRNNMNKNKSIDHKQPISQRIKRKDILRKLGQTMSH